MTHVKIKDPKDKEKEKEKERERERQLERERAAAQAAKQQLAAQAGIKYAPLHVQIPQPLNNVESLRYRVLDAFRVDGCTNHSSDVEALYLILDNTFYTRHVQS